MQAWRNRLSQRAAEEAASQKAVEEAATQKQNKVDTIQNTSEPVKDQSQD